MNKTKSLTKTIMVAVFAFAMLISGIVFSMPQSKQNEVYADGATPTAMQKSFGMRTLDFYPAFADGSAPSGIMFYTKSGETYTKIDNPTMSVIASKVGSGTLYFTGGTITGFAVVKKTWNDAFNGDNYEYTGYVAKGLTSNFAESLNNAGMTTPYFTSNINGDVSTTGNWNYGNNGDPTLNGIAIQTICTAYSSIFGNDRNFWSSKVFNENMSYYYDAHNYLWISDERSNENNIIILCEFTSTAASYSVTYNLNEGNGTAPTTDTKYSVGDEITLPDGTGLSKTDKVFLGWSTNSSATTGNVGSYTIQEGDVVSDAITFYAVWGQNQETVTANSEEEFWQLNNTITLPTVELTGLTFECGKIEDNKIVKYTTISASNGKLVYSNANKSLNVYDGTAQDKWLYATKQIVFSSPVVVGSPLHTWLTANASKQYSYVISGTSESLCAEYTKITSSTTSLSAGWYIVDSDVTISDRITCTGAVNLILLNGKTLTASAGITVSGSGNSLTIYGQKGNTGKLVATGSMESAGIGGYFDEKTNSYKDKNSGKITINGGTVTATGSTCAAGIGGVYEGSGSDITINGGTVTATGGTGGAGIGGGFDGSGSNITINGGTVTATGGIGGAGIGGGACSYGSNITINGGTVTATGGQAGEDGIGNGQQCDTNSSNIYFGDAVVIQANTSNTFTDENKVAHARTEGNLTDVALSLKGKQYVSAHETFQVTYHDGSGEAKNMPSDDTYYEIDADVTISKTTPTRTGYTFLGWATSSGGELITSETVKMIDGGVTLFAKWEEDSSGGTPNAGIYFNSTCAYIAGFVVVASLVFVLVCVKRKKSSNI